MQVFVVITHSGWGEATTVDGVFRLGGDAEAELARQKAMGYFGVVEEMTLRESPVIQPLVDE